MEATQSSSFLSLANYCLCNWNRKQAFVPEKLLGKIFGERAFAKSDTWFSVSLLPLMIDILLTEFPKDYKVHYNNLILSESKDSYILLNKESYDRRQYPEWFDANHKPGSTPEGQAFAHTLVIPKRRIFNIVDPDATAHCGAIINEMKEHFVKFWDNDGPRKILKGTQDVIGERNNILACKSKSGATFNSLVSDVWATYQEMSELFFGLKSEDFIYAFHPFPHCSVGHLHMHVFPEDHRFRTVSTTRHDWKTIPLEVILDAE